MVPYNCLFMSMQFSYLPIVAIFKVLSLSCDRYLAYRPKAMCRRLGPPTARVLEVRESHFALSSAPLIGQRLLEKPGPPTAPYRHITSSHGHDTHKIRRVFGSIRSPLNRRSTSTLSRLCEITVTFLASQHNATPLELADMYALVATRRWDMFWLGTTPFHALLRLRTDKRRV